MQFVLTSEHTYWWPVKVKMPDPDPKRAGKIMVQEFDIQFMAMPTDEAQQLAEEIAALPAAERQAREHDHILHVSRDWRGVVDNEKAAVTFSSTALRAAIQSPFFRIAIYRAYVESTSGEEARKGN